MNFSETEVTGLIAERFFADFLQWQEVDVAIAGAGPSGVTAARILASSGLRVVVLERNLYVGGGMWGGGMLFPFIVVQEEAAPLLREVGVRLQPSHRPGLYTADAVEAVTRSTSAAIEAGARICVGLSAEDLVVREAGRVCGVVFNWSAVGGAGLHVDPLALQAPLVIDATGHDAELVRVLIRKNPEARLETPGGEVMGERSMWAERGEEELLRNTREVYPGLLVAGMAANAVYGSHRMGAIFGGMLLSAQKAARLALQLLGR